jgi:hypothetical protein
LERYPSLLERMGFKISYDDTYVSRKLMFFCEEGAIVPQRVVDLPAVTLKRGEGVSIYIDYPRIRLLIPVKTELDRSSYSNLGRYRLLGQESRWARNSPGYPAFEIAGLLQHLLVPEDRDNICPYVPAEIGGDGSYHSSPEFLYNIVKYKSRISPREVEYRMDSLLKKEFGLKFCRSERSDQVVHSYHLWAPYRDQFRGIIPQDALVEFKDETHKIMVSSLRDHRLEAPTVAIMRMFKAAFYRHVLMRGEVPPPLSLNFIKLPTQPLGGWKGELNYVRFLKSWINPGFSFRNREEYLVRKDKLEVQDYLSLKWEWRRPSPPVYEELDRFHRYMEQTYDAIEDGRLQDIPKEVEDIFHLYGESDSLILGKLKLAPPEGDIVLISCDINLALKIRRMFDVNVVVVNPAIYLVGMTPELPGTIIEDPGAIWYCDQYYFQEGWSPPEIELLFCGEIDIGPKIRRDIPFYTLPLTPKRDT